MSMYGKNHYNIVKPPTNKNKWEKNPINGKKIFGYYLSNTCFA